MAKSLQRKNEEDLKVKLKRMTRLKADLELNVKEWSEKHDHLKK